MTHLFRCSRQLDKKTGDMGFFSLLLYSSVHVSCCAHSTSMHNGQYIVLVSTRTKLHCTHLLGQRVDQLRQHLVVHHGLGQVVGVVGQPAERHGGGLLDGGHVVQQQRAQQRHGAGLLQCLDVLQGKEEEGGYEGYYQHSRGRGEVEYAT